MDDRDHVVVDWPPPPRRRPRRIGRWLLLALVAVIVFGGGTALTYYVDALWFGSLGYADVFWKTVKLQGTVFSAFAGVTFLVLYGSFLALKPARFSEFAGGTIMINGQPVKVQVERVLRLIAIGLS